MREPKCPFCNSELVGTIGHPYCRNKKCEMFHEPMSMELLDLLDRTRKALETAVDVLKRIQFRGEHSKYWVGKDDGTIALKALEKITALEQKDVK